MIENFAGKTAVPPVRVLALGWNARIGARLGMNLVLVDVQQDALDTATAEMQAAGAQVLARKVDVSNAAQMEKLALDVQERFGAPHLVFNNAGVGAGGLVWENSVRTGNGCWASTSWGWCMACACSPHDARRRAKDPAWRGHIVNTASMAGLLAPPNMGIYNVSKHAVVSLSETLYQDLSLVTDQVGASVLCPILWLRASTTAIATDRMPCGRASPPRARSLAGHDRQAVSSGKVTAAEVAQKGVRCRGRGPVLHLQPPQGHRRRADAHGRHPAGARNPTDPFADKPELGVQLRAQLRAA